MSNTIAWLVPTTSGSPADKATLMPENAFRSVSLASAPSTLSSRLSTLKTASSSSSVTSAIHLSFDQAPKKPGSFILGTDPRACDVVLPKLPGIARQHCAISFDAHSRLVLDDFSDRGTSVWYDWESTGDRANHSWLLSSGQFAESAFPGNVRRIVLDIQGVRFQVVVEDHAADWPAFVDKVDAFCEDPSWVDGLSGGWDAKSLAPVAPLFAASPLFQHIYVQSIGDDLAGDFYLWNLARPWEPMVKAMA